MWEAGFRGKIGHVIEPTPGRNPVLTFAAATRAALARLETSCDDDAVRIDAIRELEDLKAALSAAQAKLTVAFVASQRAARSGERPDRTSDDAGAQIALARRESPHQGGRLVGMARALVAEMPHTLAALEAGAVNEFRALLLVRETACLSAEDRGLVDAEVCRDQAALAGVGTRRIVALARAAACRIDPGAMVARAERAVASRCVTLRPAPDSMTYLTAVLPLAAGVACYQALRKAAGSAATSADGRGRGQAMADTLVERLTGQSSAARVPVGVHLVMTDGALLGGGAEPAHLQGLGPIPAALARRIVAQSGKGSWLRRLYTKPGRHQLVAVDSRARCFPAGLARLIELRDQTCRMPWCGAPIRHLDHVVPYSEGGATKLDNGQGLCEACNHIKQGRGWRQTVVAARPGEAAEVETITPTGHRYRSRAPDPPKGRAKQHADDLTNPLERVG